MHHWFMISYRTMCQIIIGATWLSHIFHVVALLRTFLWETAGKSLLHLTGHSSSTSSWWTPCHLNGQPSCVDRVYTTSRRGTFLTVCPRRTTGQTKHGADVGVTPRRMPGHGPCGGGWQWSLGPRADGLQEAYCQKQRTEGNSGSQLKGRLVLSPPL